MADKTSHLKDLVFDPENARLHNPRNIGMIATSLQENGAGRSILIDENNQIIAGNGVTEAAAQVGIEKVKIVDVDGETIVAVRRSGLTPDQKKRMALFDNRTAELATWDTERLKFDFDLLDGMFNKSELERLGVIDRGIVPPADMANAEAALAKWGCKPGDVWQCGNHRIACGDCTDKTVISHLMGGEKAVLLWTDPPYNVDYGGKIEVNNDLGDKKRTIKNDNMTEEKFLAFITKAVAMFFENLVPGGVLYCCMSAQEWPGVDKIIRETGFHWSSTIIWVKDRLVIGRKDYHPQYEAMWYGWRGGSPRVHKVANRKESDTWMIDRPSTSEDHPTMKPVQLVERSLLNSSKPGDIVFDPFSGSGTTLVTCESIGRVARACELEPIYVAVTLERWAKQTGSLPVLSQ